MTSKAMDLLWVNTENLKYSLNFLSLTLFSTTVVFYARVYGIAQIYQVGYISVFLRLRVDGWFLLTNLVQTTTLGLCITIKI